MLVMFDVTVPVERKHAMTKVDRRGELIDLKGLLGSEEDYLRTMVEAIVQATTLRAPTGGMEARALLGLCDRYYLLTEIIDRADMRWHGDPGESVPAGNAWLYERCREVEGA
jgi:hypothetical protein